MLGVHRCRHPSGAVLIGVRYGQPIDKGTLSETACMKRPDPAGSHQADVQRALLPCDDLVCLGNVPNGNVPVSIIAPISMSRPPTIIDVARRAGLSKSVVSRVMRGERSVSPASRAAVSAAAEQLGYRANAVARSLVQRRTYNVGVMVSDLHNIFFAEVLDGLYAAAAARGYRALITTGNRDPAAERIAVEQLLELRADGVVLAGARLEADVIAAFARSVPIALVGSDVRLREVDVVVDDDSRGAALAVEHLIGLGHRDIALIDGGHGAGDAQRRAGYESAMRRARLARVVRLEPGDFTEEGGYKGAHRLLRRGNRPTAIFASNDQSAVGALNAIEEA